MVEVDDIDVLICSRSSEAFAADVAGEVYQRLVEVYKWSECWLRAPPDQSQNKSVGADAGEALWLFACIKVLPSGGNVLLDGLSCHPNSSHNDTDDGRSSAAGGSPPASAAHTLAMSENQMVVWDHYSRAALSLAQTVLWPARRCRAYDFSVPCPQDLARVLSFTVDEGRDTCLPLPLGPRFTDPDASRLLAEWYRMDRAGFASMRSLLATCEAAALPTPMAAVTFASKPKTLKESHTQSTPVRSSHSQILMPEGDEEQDAMPLVAVCISGQLRTLTKVIPSTWYDQDGDVPWQKPSSTMLARWHAFREDFVDQATVAQNILWGLRGIGESFDVFMYVQMAAPLPSAVSRSQGPCMPLSAVQPPGRLFCEVAEERPLRWQEYLSKAVSSAYRFLQGPLYQLDRTVLQQLYGMTQCDRMRREHENAADMRYEWIVRLRPDNIFYAPLPRLEVLTKVRLANGNAEVFLGQPLRLHDMYDKFAVGTRDAMSVYLNRLNSLRDAEVEAKLLAHGQGWEPEDTLRAVLEVHGIQTVSRPELLVDVFRTHEQGSGSSEP
eukprot:gnl/TRDRNA2_/TRDRNA2_172068_c0_seq1.p1 gnl/TRDRNA2_/TRDRNA2_172068_c0~~gnl/TRDRNA2_/TRDRNA2_172068_c0_seq1.p1  ORF type:complete len:569 (-),score=79.23 gnl/TRDRNA2_/TRDRNA2_172068_c0_seq1:48-1706(-)